MTRERRVRRDISIGSRSLRLGRISSHVQFKILPVASIKTRRNPRSDLGDLSELRDSIKRHGVLQPVLVSKQDDVFVLIAGHRRFEATKLLGLNTIPARIIALGGDSEVLALVENLQREDLSPIDEINEMSRLARMFGGNQVELGQAIGKSASFVSRCLKAADFIREHGISDRKLSRAMLLELPYTRDPGAVLQAIHAGELTNSRNLCGRARSGPISGGRYGAMGSLQYRERSNGRSFSLRLNFDPDRTPAESREKIISTLESVLRRLKGSA